MFLFIHIDFGALTPQQRWRIRVACPCADLAGVECRLQLVSELHCERLCVWLYVFMSFLYSCWPSPGIQDLAVVWGMRSGGHREWCLA